MMLQTIWNSFYQNTFSQEKLNSTYSKNTYYVFKRKMHDSSHYHAYSKANSGLATNITMSSPAFPTFLFPPDETIKELEKSPKLTLKEDFRHENWRDIIGEFEFILDDLEVTSKKYLDYKQKLIKYLNTKNMKDDFIHSIWYIEKLNENKYYCCHMADITKKYDGTYSEKTSKYFSQLNPYTVTIENHYICSTFGKN